MKKIEKLELLKKQSKRMVDRDLKFLLDSRDIFYKKRHKLNSVNFDCFLFIISNIEELLKGDFAFHCSEESRINECSFDFDEALKTQSLMKKQREECYANLTPKAKICKV